MEQIENQLENDEQFLPFIEQFLTDQRKILLHEVLEKRTRHVTVVLDDIFHSHNAGAILRNCDCFGIQDIHIVENRYSWERHPRVESGSKKWLTMHRYNGKADNTLDCFKALKAKGYKIAATTPHTDLSIDDLPLDQPIAFVFGAERRGVSELALQNADLLCRIPMHGFTESFNVSVAAALTLHAMRRRLAAENIPHALSIHEKKALKYLWTRNSLKHIEKYERAYLGMKKKIE